MTTKELVGFCDRCDEWYKFEGDDRLCPECNGRPSSKIGFQITSQSTFNASAKRMSKSQLKKMNSVGA